MCINVPDWTSRLFKCTHLHSFLIRLPAFLVIFFGNSIMSIPLKMILYVFIGSGPENGGLNQKCTLDFRHIRRSNPNTHSENILAYLVKSNERKHVLPSSQEFVHKNSQRPVVCWDVMAFIQYDFWGYILRRSTESPCFLPKSDLFSKAKVHLQETNSVF